jgi:hypothetical protein
MDTTVNVTIPVEPEAAAALQDTRKREIVGRVVSRMLRPKPSVEALMDAIKRLKTDAHARGLTDEMIDDELAAYNAERRS